MPARARLPHPLSHLTRPLLPSPTQTPSTRATGRPPSQADAPITLAPTGGFVAPGSGGGNGGASSASSAAAPDPVAVASSKGRGLTAPGDPCPIEGCPIETFSFVDVVIARGKAGVRQV